MVWRWAQVLAQSEDIYANLTQVVHGGQDFFVGLAQAEHQAGFGEHVWPVLLGMGQHTERLLIACTRVAHPACQPFYGFYVLRKHLKAGVQYLLYISHYRIEVRR